MAAAAAVTGLVEATPSQPTIIPLPPSEVSARVRLFRSRSAKAREQQQHVKRPSSAVASPSKCHEPGPSNPVARLGFGRWRSRTSSTTSSNVPDHANALPLSRTTSELGSILHRRSSAAASSIHSSSTAAHVGQATTEEKAGRRARKLSFKKAAPSAWARYLGRGPSQSGPHALPPSISAPIGIRSSSSSPSISTDSRPAKSTAETMEFIDQDEPVFAITRDGPQQDGLGRSLADPSSSGDVGYIDYSRRPRTMSLDALEEANMVVLHQERHQGHPLDRRQAQSSSGHEVDRRPATTSAQLPSISLNRSASERMRGSNIDRVSERSVKRSGGPPLSGGRRRRTSSTRSSDDERAARIRANLALAGSSAVGVPSPPSSVRSGSTQSSMSGCSPGTFGPQTRLNDEDAGGGSLGCRNSDSTRSFPPSPSLDSTGDYSASGQRHQYLAGAPPRPPRPNRQPSQSRAELIRRQIMETQSDTGHNRLSVAREGSRGGGSGGASANSALLHARRSSQGAERILESAKTAMATGGLSPSTAAWEASAANAPPVSPSGWYNAAHGGAPSRRPSSAGSGKSITDLRREAASHWGGRAADPTLIKMALAQASPTVGAGGSFSSRISLASSGGGHGGGKAPSLTSFQSGDQERQPVLPPRFGSMEGPAVPRTHQRTSSLVRFVASGTSKPVVSDAKEERIKKRRDRSKADKTSRDKALPPRPSTASGVLSLPSPVASPTKPSRDPATRVPVRYDAPKESGSSGQSSSADEGSRGSSGGVHKAEMDSATPLAKSPVSPTPPSSHVLAYTNTAARQGTASTADVKTAAAKTKSSSKTKGGEAASGKDVAEEGKRRRGFRFLARIIH